MSDEQRKEPRLEVRLAVELEYDGAEPSVMHTRDMSQNGVFLEKEEFELPQVGSIVYVKMRQSLTGDATPKVKAKVVRINNEGIALQFLDE